MEQGIQSSMQAVVENQSQRVSQAMASEIEVAGSSISNAKKISRTHESSAKRNKDQKSEHRQTTSNTVEKVEDAQAKPAVEDQKQRSRDRAKSASDSYAHSNGTGNEIQIQRMSNNELSSISKTSQDRYLKQTSMDDQQRDYKEMYQAICVMAPKLIAEIEKSHPETKSATTRLQQLISDPLCFDSEQPDDGQPFATSAEKTLLI